MPRRRAAVNESSSLVETMSFRVGGRIRSASSSVRWPPVCTMLLPLLLLVAVVLADTKLALPLGKIPPLSIPKWFYNGTDASATCQTTFRCDTSSRNGTVPVCSCHPNCSLYDACCEDVRPSDWQRRMLPIDAYECAVYPTLNIDSQGRLTLGAAAFVFLITKCPSTYPVSIIANLCVEVHNKSLSSNESLQELWVTEKTTGITYCNKFCALCNGVPANRMIFWNNSSICINNPAAKPFGLTGCKHNVLPAEIDTQSVPKCMGPLQASCTNGSSPQMQEACVNSPTKHIYDTQYFKTYRNYNCSLCTSLEVSNSLGCSPYALGWLVVDQGLQALLAFDICPKKLTTFASKDVQADFSQLCPDVVFDTENCSETVNMTVLLASHDDALNYRITSNGVQLWLNDSYSVCYACQPLVTYNYSRQSENLTTADSTFTRPLYQVTDNGSATVCLAPNKPIEDWLLQNPCDALPAVVDVVLMSLSLFGLAMYAVAYAVLPSLRNLPGQIVLHQSAAFFAAFLLWLLRTQAQHISEACIALGVLIHFFFLAAFTWTTVYAFEVVRALGFQAYGAGYTKRRMRYTLAGWLVPLIITVISIAVNWAPQGKIEYILRPAYGAPQCFINSQTSYRIFFTAPLAVFLLLDVIIYAYVIFKLVVISGQTKLVRENHHEKLLLAVKLVFALGITWIFAVLASATENCDLAYIFRVLNSLQGVFLFLIFICNAKTSGQIHQKVRGQKSLTSGVTTGVTVSSRESSSSTTSILSKRKSVLGVKSFSPVSLAMDAREHASKPPPR